jgi:hypothetical protein
MTQRRPWREFSVAGAGCVAGARGLTSGVVAASHMTERLIRNIDDLVEAIRARRDDLDLSHELIDHLAGFQAGYTSKLLAPNPMKGLGRMSMPALLGALGVGLTLVEDPAQVERMRDKWTPRRRVQRKPPPD